MDNPITYTVSSSRQKSKVRTESVLFFDPTSFDHCVGPRGEVESCLLGRVVMPWWLSVSSAGSFLAPIVLRGAAARGAASRIVKNRVYTVNTLTRMLRLGRCGSTDTVPPELQLCLASFRGMTDLWIAP